MDPSGRIRALERRVAVLEEALQCLKDAKARDFTDSHTGQVHGMRVLLWVRRVADDALITETGDPPDGCM
jgi:hypothetical protein